MPKSLVVRYRTKPESADENARLVRAVFAELAETRPDGFSYRALRLDDGVSFIHVVTQTAQENPLASSPAFATFQDGIADRCVDGPTPTGATLLGSFG